MISRVVIIVDDYQQVLHHIQDKLTILSAFIDHIEDFYYFIFPMPWFLNGETAQVAITNCGTSILAGCVVFPVLGHGADWLGWWISGAYDGQE